MVLKTGNKIKQLQIRAVQSKSGRFDCYIGKSHATALDQAEAQKWLDERIATGFYKVSEHSELKCTGAA